MIPFLDLAAIHPPLQRELVEAFSSVLEEGAFVLGPAVEQFEQSFAAYVGRRHCIGLNSGTSALHLALKACGVGAGDEVITTSHTWISTSWAITYCGATPVFADVDPATGNMDAEQVKALVMARTKAILPVDPYGNPATLALLEKIASADGLFLIDDACQAHGSRLNGKEVGSFGRAACFSFYPGKNLGALGEGGAVITDDDALADHVRLLRDHAQSGRHNHVEIGFNHRMDGVQAAALEIKLRCLNGWNDARRLAATRYFELQRLFRKFALLKGPFATSGADATTMLIFIPNTPEQPNSTWRTTHGDMTDEEWDLIADLVPVYSGGGRMGRPAVHARRDIVNAIFYVAATGCQWRALPACYPNWNTVHRYHLTWSRHGTWEEICDRLRILVREMEGHGSEPSASVIDARSVRGAATVTSPSRGYDAGKKISGRKAFGIVDTLGLLVAIVVVAASVSDNVGGIATVEKARTKSGRLTKIFCDGGFKRSFVAYCGGAHTTKALLVVGPEVHVVLEELADDLAHVRREAVLQLAVGHDGGLLATNEAHDLLEQFERTTEGAAQASLLFGPDASTSSAKPALAWSSKRACATR